MRVSVVISTLNAGHTLAATVAALETGPDHGIDTELVVVDGGSTDGTVEAARALGARAVRAKRGRGPQLRTGADHAEGPWLLFLHADTRLGPGWRRDAAGFARGARAAERAGWFRFALDDDAAPARRLERLVHWRSRRLGLPYGDQGLLIHRDFYQRLGGYPDIPLMEDVALVRRIGRARLVALPTPAVTSAARYRRDGYLGRSTAQPAVPRALPPRRAAAADCPALRTGRRMRHLAVFARHPRMGGVKSRLAGDIGTVAATFWYRRTVAALLGRLGPPQPWRCHLFLTGSRPWRHPPWPRGWILHDQACGPLGERMRRALAVPRTGPVVLVGSDIPGIRPGHIRDAFRTLGHADFVFGPASDGGYWLIGVSARAAPPDLADVRWSTEHALADTLACLGRNRRVALLERLRDVDDAADLHALRVTTRGRGARVRAAGA